MKKSLSIILLIVGLICSNISFMTPIINHKYFLKEADDYGILSDKINFKGNEINSNITFSDFYDFLTQYNNFTETEKATIINNYILWQETDGGGFPDIQNVSHVIFNYFNTTISIESCAIVGDFSAYNAINMTRLDTNFSFFF